MFRVISVVIPGAGLGSRMGMNLPKLMLEVGGVSLVERHLRMVSGLGTLAVVAGFRAESVVQKIHSLSSDVMVVMNQNYAGSGTAGSVKLACRFLPPGEILVLDGDVLFDEKSVSKAIAEGESCLGIGPVQSRDPVFARLSDDRKSVLELSQDRASDFEWSGLAILKKAEIEGYGDQHMFTSINMHLPKRAVKTSWHEIDYPEDLELAHQWLDKLE